MVPEYLAEKIAVALREIMSDPHTHSAELFPEASGKE
jgi:hypothetical protein